MVEKGRKLVLDTDTPRCFRARDMTRAPFLLLALAAAAAAAPSFHMVDVALPPYETAADEEYLCTAVGLPGGGADPLKLTAVAPLASKEVVHHMLLFGE